MKFLFPGCWPKIVPAALLASLAITSFSCGPETTAPPSPLVEGASSPVKKLSVGSNTAPAAVSSNGTVSIPKEATFTLYCRDFSGQAHIDEANRAKTELMKNTPLHDWYVIHQQDRSTLFYGYYRDTQDPALAADRKRVEAVTDKLGDKLFRNTTPLPIDAADPVAPTEWNLANLRRGTGDMKHFWSLQIAAYKDSPERKKAAVDMVRDARTRGVEAYFYHGPSISSVCIGCWPADAVRRQDASTAEPSSSNPDEKILVSQQPISQKMAAAMSRNNVTVMTPVLDVVDPQLRQTMQQYPQHFVNGLPEGRKDAQNNMVPKPSALVEIPYSAPSAFNNTQQVVPTPEAVRALSPAAALPAGSGKLRGLDGK